MRFFYFLPLILLVNTIMIPVYGQEISIGKPADQKYVQVEIDKDGNVVVEHKVRSTSQPKELKLIEGVRENFSVTDEEGNEKQFGTVNDLTILILPSDEDVLVKYQLKDVLVKIDGTWFWDFFYWGNVNFYFSEDVDLVFSNERPVFFGDSKGMKCHGCQMKLEYIMDEPEYEYKVKWEQHEFEVKIRTLGEIKSVEFDQPTKRISMQYNGQNDFVTVIMPLELLWNPYEVTLNDKQIFKHEFNKNSTHAWISFRPAESGGISVIGTTAIPEFPILMPLVLGMILIVVVQIKSRFTLR